MWSTAYFCIKCHQELTDFQRMYSNGRCPLCGYKHPSACTIVEVFERPFKWVRINPRWKFWKKQYERQIKW